jgi:ubiquinone biosynthesis protein
MTERSTIEKGRERLRLQQSYNIIGRYVMDLTLDRGIIGSIRRFFVEKLYGLPHLTHLTAPEKIRYLLQDLGPIYVKVGQLISSQSQALPPEWATEMDKLQSNVRPFSYEQVEETIISELGSPPDEIYATFSHEPLAAASLAQVHRATLKTGEQVVAKIQRPNIQNQVKADVGIMNWLAGLAEQRSGWVRDMGLIGIVDEFGKQVLLELNYGNEAYNAIRLENNLADIEGIRLPVIYAELCTDRILTMEFVDGFKINDLDQIEAAGISREHLATIALRATIKQILIDGFFHGDLHPGNILVNRADGDIVLLDTGMVGELDINQRFNLIGVLLALFQKDVRGLAMNVRALSKPFKPFVDEKAYEKQFERQIGRLMQMSNASFSQVIDSVMSVQRDNGLAFDPSLTLAIKSIMQMEAISSVLFPGSGLLDQGLATTLELVREQITEENITKVIKQEATNTLREMAQRLPSLHEATLSWLDQYQKGRLEVYHNFDDLDAPIAEGGRLLRQLIIGILLTGIIVGSAIATGIAAAFGTGMEASTVFTTIAFIGYVAATVGAGLFILELLWRLWRSDSGSRD